MQMESTMLRTLKIRFSRQEAGGWVCGLGFGLWGFVFKKDNNDDMRTTGRLLLLTLKNNTFKNSLRSCKPQPMRLTAEYRHTFRGVMP